MGASFRTTISGMVCGGESRGGARGARSPPPLFLDETEARRVEKNIFGDRASLLSQGLDDLSPPPPLPPRLNSMSGSGTGLGGIITGNQKLTDHCSRCPPKRSHKTLRRKLVPIFPVVYRLANEEAM